MATDSDLQCVFFTGSHCPKWSLDLELRLSGLEPQGVLRRVNKPQKCFVSGETESVANTSAFVGPVALLFLFDSSRVSPGIHAIRATGARTEPNRF